MVKFLVKEPVYNSSVQFIICKYFEDCKKALKNWETDGVGLDDSDGKSWSVRTPKGKIYRYVWVSEFGTGILSHEVFHACFLIFQNKGMETVSVENEEALAYLIGYYMKTAVAKAYDLGADKVPVLSREGKGRKDAFKSKKQ